MFITYKSKNIAYVSSGQGDAVIFIHGDGQNNTAGKRLLAMFTKNKTIAYDRSGHGNSQEFSSTLNDECAILKRLCKKEGVTSPLLIAHSSGAAIALQFARRNAVRSLVLLDPLFVDPHKIFWYLPLRLLEKAYFKKAQKLFVKKEFVDFSACASEGEIKEAVLKHTPTAVLEQDIRMLGGFDSGPYLTKLTMPVFVLCSTKGMLSLASHAKKCVRELPNGKIIYLGCAHNEIVMSQETIDILQRSRSFLRTS